MWIKTTYTKIKVELFSNTFNCNLFHAPFSPDFVNSDLIAQGWVMLAVKGRFINSLKSLEVAIGHLTFLRIFSNSLKLRQVNTS